MRNSESTLLGRFWKITALSFLFTSAVYIWVPWLRKPLVRENNILELVTALLFLAVCVLGVKYLVDCRAAYHEKVYWSIPVLGLIGFLEETSFGHSFLYYDVPVIQGVKIDAVHDFLKVFVQGFQADPISWSLIGWTTVMSVVGLYVIIRFHLYDYRWYVRLFDSHLPLKFVALCIGFLGLATVLDLELLTHHYWVFLEEFFEAAASLALLFSYLAMKEELSTC